MYLGTFGYYDPQTKHQQRLQVLTGAFSLNTHAGPRYYHLEGFGQICFKILQGNVNAG